MEKKVRLDRPTGSQREQKSLYIYFDHHFKTVQVVRPDPNRFDGNWKLLADSITSGAYYKYIVK
jgi:hypothetical protein